MSFLTARELDEAVPVSRNVKSARLTAVASGPQSAYDEARPYLELFGRKVTYVGCRLRHDS
jgi:3-hydroxyisobutyrate dehydrogenase-like beta-hydroxyacid dehydrogenase